MTQITEKIVPNGKQTIKQTDYSTEKVTEFLNGSIQKEITKSEEDYKSIFTSYTTTDGIEEFYERKYYNDGTKSIIEGTIDNNEYTSQKVHEYWPNGNLKYYGVNDDNDKYAEYEEFIYEDGSTKITENFNDDKFDEKVEYYFTGGGYYIQEDNNSDGKIDRTCTDGYWTDERSFSQKVGDFFENLF